ncbi:hypothetical protein [Tellurirhabdus bombi]|uniref:hypothetical protein n=1 Tax=Tellurirhabdus bombi TaxID=2907205 RepID=UPI001F469E8B|nr:hypothetical protein [Tellurirhabdus bombi]
MNAFYTIHHHAGNNTIIYHSSEKEAFAFLDHLTQTNKVDRKDSLGVGRTFDNYVLFLGRKQELFWRREKAASFGYKRSYISVLMVLSKMAWTVFGL